MTKTTNIFPSIILASGSATRRQQLMDANIPFEVIVSDADETPDESKFPRDQLAEIAMRKATTVAEMTKNRGRRLIVAADSNVMFEGKLYGKPKSVAAARELLLKMRGREDIYYYVGNAIVLAEHDNVLQVLNLTDVAKLSFDNISDEKLTDYLESTDCLSLCGGINIVKCSFIHLKAGRHSTAKGMTIEYVKEMLPNL